MNDAQSNFYRYDTDGNPLGLSWAGCEAARAAKLPTRLVGNGYRVAVDEAGEEVDLETLPKRAPTKSQLATIRKILDGSITNTLPINSNHLNSLLAKDLIRTVTRPGGPDVEVTAHGCVSFNKAEGR
jgi:hypothetical protein